MDHGPSYKCWMRMTSISYRDEIFSYWGKTQWEKNEIKINRRRGEQNKNAGENLPICWSQPWASGGKKGEHWGSELGPAVSILLFPSLFLLLSLPQVGSPSLPFYSFKEFFLPLVTFLLSNTYCPSKEIWKRETDHGNQWKHKQINDFYSLLVSQCIHMNQNTLLISEKMMWSQLLQIEYMLYNAAGG